MASHNAMLLFKKKGLKVEKDKKREKRAIGTWVT